MTDQTQDEISAALDRVLSDVADLPAISRSKKIVVKVNLCKPFPPDSGATVDVRVTRGVIDWILRENASAEMFVVESDTARRAVDEAFRATGHSNLTENCKSLKLVNLSKTPRVTIGNRRGGTHRSRRFKHFKNGLSISSTFLDCDYFVSIAKLKTHETERFTGILKNQFGCLPDKFKDKYHPYLSNVISDVNVVLRPDLCVIDGIVAMEGEGPNFGAPREMNVLIGGNDPVATDAVAARVMGMDPYSVSIIRKAGERGIGEIELDKVLLKGERIESVQEVFDFVPTSAFVFHRFSLAFQRFGDLLTHAGRGMKGAGGLMERLARALYSRGLAEIVARKSPALLSKRIKTPGSLARLVIRARVALGRK